MGLVVLRISGRDGVVANPRRSEILSVEFALDQELWQGAVNPINGVIRDVTPTMPCMSQPYNSHVVKES
jgi:hypothetical protein